MNKRYITLIAAIILSIPALFLHGYAQHIPTSLNSQELRSAYRITAFSKNLIAPAFIKFTDEHISALEGAMPLLANALQMSADDELRLIRNDTDNLGYVHHRYQQYYRNIKVESGQYLIHEKNGVAVSANGNWVDHISINTIPSLSESAAAEYAQQFISRKNYSGNSKKKTLVLSAITTGKGETVIVAEDLDFEKNELCLCYKFEVTSVNPFTKNIIYVDANSGKIIASENEIECASVTATANTIYSGSQTIKADSVSASSFRLRDGTRGSGIETYNVKKSTNLANAVDFTSTSTLFNTSTNKDNAAYDVHWGMEAGYDYFLNVHGRNSIDNAGKKIISYVHYDSPGAFQAGRIGDGLFAFNDGTGAAGGFNPWTSLDLVTHELTHGLTFHTAGLHYGGESAALNESFSDIFGTCIEFYKKPATADFQIGEQAGVTAGTIVRSLANPKLTNLPNTYKGTYWYSGGNDNGGAHTNCGVQNYWFYLICQGGSGTNDNSNSYSVSGIGITKAAKIAYRTLTVYLTSFSNYADTRTLSIQAAADLYGICSAEVKSVTDAWYAVGVGAAYSASVSANFSASGTTSCSVPFDVQFNNTSVNDSTAVWDFGDGATSTSINPTHTYTNPGTYTVKLVSASCEGIDSLTKPAYITISTPTSPLTTAAASCSSSALVLKASGSGNLKWYAAATGGASLFTGTNFITPVLDSTKTYYVEDEVAGTKSNFGPTTWQGQYGSLPSQYVNFNILQSAILRSVKTNSYLAGKRKIQIRDNRGAVVFDSIYDLPLGAVTIPINAVLAPGSGYRIGGDTLYFAFDGTNTSYPYTLPGVASITGNTVSNSLYLFFYDWQIETAPCKSVRTPVTATIYQPPILSLKFKTDTLCEKAASITLEGGSPSGGTYSGAGVTGTTFDPKIAGTGDIPITYSYTDAHGCSNSITKNIFISKDPTVTLVLPKDTLCETGSPVTLSGGNPLAGSYSGVGVKNGVFDPQSAGIGEFLITYNYADLHSCTNTASQKIAVVASPVVSLKLPVDTICDNADQLMLSGGSPVGGTYSGTGVIAKNGSFNPALSGKGTFLITYFFSDGNSCANTASQNITVRSCSVNEVIAPVANDAIRVFSESNTGNIIIFFSSVAQHSVDADFDLYNAIGGKVYSARLSAPRTEVPLHLASGIYFHRIRSAGKVSTGKVVVQ